MSETPDQSPALDFDQLLESVDPGFTKSLADLGHINNADVDIAADALDPDHDELPDPTGPPEGASWLVRLQYRLKRIITLVGIGLRRGLELAKYAAQAFKHASRPQKGLALLMLAIFGAVAYLLLANLRGTWVPALTAPVVGRLEPYADHVDDIEDPKDLVDLKAAFPAELHEFLFRRFKVNLRPTAENPQPMAAIEFVISADTKETATETRDREVEFADMIQRLFEDQTFHDLATEMGKAQLKNRIQGALNDKLSAGRVTAVNFKTFILKP